MQLVSNNQNTLYDEIKYFRWDKVLTQDLPNLTVLSCKQRRLGDTIFRFNSALLASTRHIDKIFSDNYYVLRDVKVFEFLQLTK